MPRERHRERGEGEAALGARQPHALDRDAGAIRDCLEGGLAVAVLAEQFGGRLEDAASSAGRCVRAIGHAEILPDR